MRSFDTSKSFFYIYNHLTYIVIHLIDIVIIISSSILVTLVILEQFILIVIIIIEPFKHVMDITLEHMFMGNLGIPERFKVTSFTRHFVISLHPRLLEHWHLLVIVFLLVLDLKDYFRLTYLNQI